MKKTIAFMLMITIFVGVIPSYSNAASVSENITYFEDGSYCITTIGSEVYPTQSTLLSTSKTQKGYKTSNYYNSKHILQFSITVHGTFSYDGTSAIAHDAQYSYKISASAWKFISGKTNCQGSSATASCTFRNNNIYNKTLSVSLTCSANGKLS